VIQCGDDARCHWKRIRRLWKLSIWRIVDGKVVEMWAVADELAFYKELGVVEYKGFPDEEDKYKWTG
jgi:hypothetical protein